MRSRCARNILKIFYQIRRNIAKILEGCLAGPWLITPITERYPLPLMCFPRRRISPFIELSLKYLRVLSCRATKVEGALCLRICTWALLKDKNTGEIILFANTHLDHSNDEVRSAQMDILMDYLADRIGAYPFYLTGDFNCEVNSIPYETVTARLQDSHKTAWEDLSTAVNTYHAYTVEGKSEIDFIFHNDRTTPVQYEIISKDYDGFVSDHYGVIADFVND